MGIGKAVKLSVLIVGPVFLVIAGGLFFQASRIPIAYQPARLTAQQKQQVVKEFWVKVQTFGNAAQSNEPFMHFITQTELNEYLASMDEIASSTPSGRPGTVYRTLSTAGIAEPAVALNDGLVTLMVRSERYGKVLSADLSVQLTDDRQLAIQLVDMRIGKLAVPDAWVRGRVRRIKNVVLPHTTREASDSTGFVSRRLGGLSSQDLAQLLRTILAAIDEKPIATELTWPVNDKRVRIDGVEVRDRHIRLQVVPIGRKR